MGWIYLVIWFVCASAYHILDAAGKDLPEGSKSKKANTIAKYTTVGILGIALVSIILYMLGWIWYYFCGGFLLFEDQPFLDKIICGIISLALMIFVFGAIAIIFYGWDPDK